MRKHDFHGLTFVLLKYSVDMRLTFAHKPGAVLLFYVVEPTHRGTPFIFATDCGDTAL